MLDWTKINNPADLEIKPNTILHGDCVSIMRHMIPGSVDALITDPPYSSGGLYRADRAQDTRDKYLSSGEIAADYANHSFTGDNLDQRAWTSWAAQWLTHARHAVKQGGIAAVFVDWRQLGALSDAIQWAGWVWRGVLVWDKKTSRPQPGRPRQQCEFIVWASNGALSVERDAPYMPGIFTHAPPMGDKRLHQTEKPLPLMRELVHLCERGGVILDPFAGSGSTLAAAVMEGYKFLGIEKDSHYIEVAMKRVKETLKTREVQGNEQTTDTATGQAGSGA
jgi:site-specific DNA-methyltransferase (adenine-specific)